jgi:hypothetical protein
MCNTQRGNLNMKNQAMSQLQTPTTSTSESKDNELAKMLKRELKVLRKFSFSLIPSRCQESDNI